MANYNTGSLPAGPAKAFHPRPAGTYVRMSYVELPCHSAFSFLDGASLPEDLIDQAAQKDVPAMALVDTNGVYGAPRFYTAAKKADIKALVGAELVLECGGRATVLVENRTGYKNLCKLITAGAAEKPKGEARFTWELIEQYADGLHCLTRADDETLQKISGIFKWRPHGGLQRQHHRGVDGRCRRLAGVRPAEDARGGLIAAASAPQVSGAESLSGLTNSVTTTTCTKFDPEPEI